MATIGKRLKMRPNRMIASSKVPAQLQSTLQGRQMAGNVRSEIKLMLVVRYPNRLDGPLPAKLRAVYRNLWSR